VIEGRRRSLTYPLESELAPFVKGKVPTDQPLKLFLSNHYRNSSIDSPNLEKNGNNSQNLEAEGTKSSPRLFPNKANLMLNTTKGSIISSLQNKTQTLRIPKQATKNISKLLRRKTSKKALGCTPPCTCEKFIWFGNTYLYNYLSEHSGEVLSGQCKNCGHDPLAHNKSSSSLEKKNSSTDSKVPEGANKIILQQKEKIKFLEEQLQMIQKSPKTEITKEDSTEAKENIAVSHC
jgi:hypothetical protein